MSKHVLLTLRALHNLGLGIVARNHPRIAHRPIRPVSGRVARPTGAPLGTLNLANSGKNYDASNRRRQKSNDDLRDNPNTSWSGPSAITLVYLHTIAYYCM